MQTDQMKLYEIHFNEKRPIDSANSITPTHFLKMVQEKTAIAKKRALFIGCQLTSLIESELEKTLFGSTKVLKNFKDGPKNFHTCNGWELLKWYLFPNKETTEATIIVFKHYQMVVLVDSMDDEIIQNDDQTFKNFEGSDTFLIKVLTLSLIHI